MLPLCNSSLSLQPRIITSIPGKPNKSFSITNFASSRSGNRINTEQKTISAFEARISLIFALASQATSLSQRLVVDVVSETAKYVFPKRFENRTLEEALMSVPDLETVKFKVLARSDKYEIREIEVLMEWEEMSTLDGVTLFASFLSSHSRTDLTGVMRNSVYFSKVRFYGKRCISFSLDDCRYYPRKQCHDWGEQDPFENIWIEPPKDFAGHM